MLWLALHFPLLSLEALPQRQSPSAVISRGRVLVCDRLARAAGIIPGQKLSTALGVQPGLAVFEHVAQRELETLENLACWSGCFTPNVSIALPGVLLLEIGGCLRLFGGAEAIVAAALAGCAGQNYSVTWAVAPTPLGARWLALASVGQVFDDLPSMQAALAELPCSIPGWSSAIGDRLESFGLKCLGDLLALPAASLRQRIGNAPVDDLQRAWGALPDPQKLFVFPDVFTGDIELPARVEHAEALAFAGQRLFAALAGWLHGRLLQVRACTLQLIHDDASRSALVLRFAEPSDDAAGFLRLLREHLANLQLRAPVEALRLQADVLVSKPGASVHLFEQASAGEGTLACLERLRARLGDAAVQILKQQADYRPECATRQHDGGQDLKDSTATKHSTVNEPLADTLKAQRPLWLLPAPQALAERAGCPQWHGPLKLLSRAERLESGWWDAGEHGAAGDLRRDYFVACNPLGQWAWIFRDADAWYLHGLFG